MQAIERDRVVFERTLELVMHRHRDADTRGRQSHAGSSACGFNCDGGVGDAGNRVFNVRVARLCLLLCRTEVTLKPCKYGGERESQTQSNTVENMDTCALITELLRILCFAFVY